MSTKLKNKKLEGLETMLSIKEEISVKYSKNPDLILNDLLTIRKKYKLESSDKKRLSLI
jgi:hypothetical protein